MCNCTDVTLGAPTHTHTHTKHGDTDMDTNQLRLSFHFKSCGLWTLACDLVPHNYETVKWLSLLPTLMQESFRCWQCSDRYIISLSPHLHTPFTPFSPSLISLVVSVDVKMMMSWCLMSSDVIWHIRDKLWPMPKHGSIKSTYVRCMRV